MAAENARQMMLKHSLVQGTTGANNGPCHGPDTGCADTKIAEESSMPLPGLSGSSESGEWF